MNDSVPKDRPGTSRLNDVFLKIYSYELTPKFQELGNGSYVTFMQSKIKICMPFFANYENVNSKIAQNLSYRLFFLNFAGNTSAFAGYAFRRLSFASASFLANAGVFFLGAV